MNMKNSERNELEVTNQTLEDECKRLRLLLEKVIGCREEECNMNLVEILISKVGERDKRI